MDRGEYKNIMKRLVFTWLMVANISYGATLDYFIDFDKEDDFNFRLSPSLLYGVFDLRPEIKISKKMSAGGIFGYSIRYSKHFVIGGGLNYKLDDGHIMKADGWIVNPFVVYGLYDGDDLAEVPSLIVGGEGAYQWVWRNGFNLRLGAGIQNGTYKVVGIHSNNVSVFLNFTLGIIF